MKAISIGDRTRTHGMTGSRMYMSWSGMKCRCFNKKNPAYNHYGGRGITVCDEWKQDFMNFYNWSIENGYTDELTIDRINNNGNYEPSNCRWTDMTQQIVNQRMNKNNTSGYTGISWYPTNKKWEANLSYNKEVLLRKFFNTKMEAVKYRNKFILDNNLPHKLAII